MKRWGWMSVMLVMGCQPALPGGGTLNGTMLAGPRNLPLAELEAEFKAIDKNGNSELTAAEYKLYPDQDTAAMSLREASFKANVDLDGDGKATWDEYQLADKTAPKLVLPSDGEAIAL